MGKQETLETIWEVPDELWERIEPIILEEDPPKARGRKRSDPRQAQRHHLPAAQRVPMEPIAERAWGRQHHSSHLSTVGGDGRHRMWGALVEGCEELDGVDWEWQAADGAMGKARLLGGPDWAQPYGPWRRLVPSAVTLWMERAAP